MQQRCLVAGAGGFIGGHLVKRLLNEGHEVMAVDIKPFGEWWQVHEGAVNCQTTDLRGYAECYCACTHIDHVYNLAADMGGIGFIEGHKADCMVSVLINTNLLRAARYRGVERYFYSSSACVYHADRQCGGFVLAPLREDDAYHNGGAMPEDGYGWEKLFSERMCRHFMEDYGLETRVARFHNVYGTHGSWDDGREKAPAAMCRKVAEARLAAKKTIDVWGDGTQLRSYMHIDDCIEGIRLIMDSDIREPINLGSAEMVTVDQLIDTVEMVANVRLERFYNPSMPRGVPGRNSDNTMILRRLRWEPRTRLIDGIARTYPWIEQQVVERENERPKK